MNNDGFIFLIPVARESKPVKFVIESDWKIEREGDTMILSKKIGDIVGVTGT